MTADQFRKNADYVAEMRATLEQPIMKMWLDCVMRASPVNNAAVQNDMTDTISNYTHGVIKGFHLHHNIFVLGGEHLVSPQSVTPAAMALEPED